ncbi:carbamate kinase [Paenibacillus sp. J2TS4]|uniref:carbamate kinase n=1 Tax=Paenibacillus sp. J2TS4 TaxID=2807194 RepID=UPI001B29F8CE|nr:carbamate kinase [Paenibacillus sp. J2TS4]GIP35371.1 carbamate kinase [Paenibacillus sp. J2TS4]
MNSKTILVALGGNAILRPKQEATFENQLANVSASCRILARLIEMGYRLIITHGNGPQVGNILRQNEEARKVVPQMPLDVCNAESQGLIGYMVQQSLRNELELIGVSKSVVSLVTRVEVSPDDQAFQNPTKPIGAFYSEEEAKELMKDKGWILKEDANRGWRRVVPSPQPIRILEADIIKRMVDQDQIVIACGGGGIPVVRKTDGTHRGIEAVIDKDHSGCKLAQEVGADVMLILTDVENAYIHYGRPEQKALTRVTIAELEKFKQEGHFSEGSMKPKIDAAARFADSGGTSIICSLNHADLALQGEKGTLIVKEAKV